MTTPITTPEAAPCVDCGSTGGRIPSWQRRPARRRGLCDGCYKARLRGSREMPPGSPRPGRPPGSATPVDPAPAAPPPLTGWEIQVLEACRSIQTRGCYPSGERIALELFGCRGTTTVGGRNVRREMVGSRDDLVRRGVLVLEVPAHRWAVSSLTRGCRPAPAVTAEDVDEVWEFESDARAVRRVMRWARATAKGASC